jgi:hypothetical protein
MKCFTICPEFAVTVEEVMGILAEPAEAAAADIAPAAKQAVAGDAGNAP